MNNIMKKSYLFLATAAILSFASCTSNEFVGDTSPTTQDVNDGSIQFGLGVKGTTRADIYGPAAATLLGNNFYVMGTKGVGTSTEVEPATTPTTNLVFDNYLVHYDVNTAGKTTSNTANWEYVGVQPGATGYTNYVYLTSMSPGRTAAPQTIKYWDYSTDSYDFYAFSTGPNTAVSSTSPSADNIGVTKMGYGTQITSGATAYTLYIPTVADLAETYITDIQKVIKSNYGKEVTLQFKNVGAKVRMALYETVPGYSVKGVKFYTVDGDGSDLSSATKNENAYLIGASGTGEYSFPTAGQIDVAFAHVGADNKSMQDYDKATATVTPTAGTEKYKLFDALNYTGKDPNGHEADGSIYLGRDLPNATFAGSAAAKYYKTVFPVTTCYPLTLRVDYTLVSTDGSGEEIKIYGAKAVVPATYTKWLPNYAYTYIFKISDNTNGWTSQVSTDPQGLFPITFDAVVTEATDVTGEQTTITTVSTPTITTYQQGHNSKTDGSFTTSVPDEYDNDGNKVYVQVMDNNLSSAVLVGTGSSTLPKLNAAQESTNPKYHASLLYKVNNANATEAMVMDALQNRNATVADYDQDVTGRNNIKLTYNNNINNSVTSIVNGVDNNAITVAAGEAAEINIASLTAGTYAYVYDYTWKSESAAWNTSTSYTPKTEVVVFEPVTPTSATAIGSKDKYYSISTTDLNMITPSTAAVTVDANHLYFSKTTNGSSITTYSYISVADKIGTTLPKGVVVIAKNDTKITEVNGTGTPVSGTFYFDKYFNNNGKYAVKVIKVVD